MQHDELDRRRAARTLRGLGFQVHELSDGRSALELLSGVTAPQEPRPRAVDLVLTDARLPRLSGHELAFALAHLRPELPVLLLPTTPDPAPAGAVVVAVVQALRKGNPGTPGEERAAD
ncbi:MAG TPA: response regulator [Gemmatimonadales bacterium]|nr:response regulator [Gemmatimonadales bacterium]